MGYIYIAWRYHLSQGKTYPLDLISEPLVKLIERHPVVWLQSQAFTHIVVLNDAENGKVFVSWVSRFPRAEVKCQIEWCSRQCGSLTPSSLSQLGLEDVEWI